MNSESVAHYVVLIDLRDPSRDDGLEEPCRLGLLVQEDGRDGQRRRRLPATQTVDREADEVADLGGNGLGLVVLVPHDVQKVLRLDVCGGVHWLDVVHVATGRVYCDAMRCDEKGGSGRELREERERDNRVGLQDLSFHATRLQL